jgi:hypothetical protein
MLPAWKTRGTSEVRTLFFGTSISALRNPYRAPSIETLDGWAYASKTMPSLEGQRDCDPQANCMRPLKGRQVFTIADPVDLRCFDDKSLDGWYDI